MSLEGKTIAIFVAKLYEDLELWYPYYRMKEEGADVILIGPERATYSGKHGLPAAADRDIASAHPDQFDALIIPGGYSPDHMRRFPPMVEFVRTMHAAGKPIAAICHGGWMLASADIVRGKNVTGFFSIKDDLVHAGAVWKDEEVVQDGNIISSRMPSDLPAFCRTLIAAIGQQR